MSDAVSRHIAKETFNNFVINMVLNGVIAWFIFKENTTLLMWGEKSFGADMLLTASLLCLLLSASVIFLNRRKVARGKLESLKWNLDSTAHQWLSRFPSNLMLASLCFAGIGIIVFGVSAIFTLYMMGIVEMTVLEYALFKGVWTGLMAAALVPPTIIFAVGREFSDVSE